MMMRKCTVLMVLIGCSAGFAAELYVSANARLDKKEKDGEVFTTIQEAVDAASDGDTIYVSSGVYSGPGNRDILITGKSVILRGQYGPESCIIQCDGSLVEPHRGFSVIGSAAEGTTLEGFTILGGYGPQEDVYDDGNLLSVGGGVYCKESFLVVRDCCFESCSAESGAGLAVVRGSLGLSDSRFHGNAANWNGGGLFAIEAEFLMITNSLFADNQADSGAGLFLGSTIGGTLQDCEFSHNHAETGGAVSTAQASTPDIIACRFHHNSAAEGGAVYNYDRSSPSLINTVMYDNEAFSGGAIYNVYSSSPILTNCTLLNNSAGEGAAMTSLFSSLPTVTNTIIWDQADEFTSVPIISAYDSTTAVTYSCVRGGVAGQGNIQGNPDIAFEDNPDYPRTGSPCVDAGTDAISGGLPETDAAGAPRIQGIAVDMGAYEVPEPPVLDVEVEQLHITGWHGHEDATATLGVRNRGAGQLNWNASVDDQWLEITPESGTSTGEINTIQLTVDVDNMLQGEYATTLTVWNADEPTDEILVSITLSIGQVRNVAPGGAGTYATIQAAIDAASPGDLILCSAGTYTGEGNRDITFRGKAITVEGDGGAASCIINCGGTELEPHCGFAFTSGETTDSVLKGFTITGGFQPFGAAILISGTNPTIEDCIFTQNWASDKGGAVYANAYAAPVLTGCLFDDNTADWNGGGFACDNAAPTFTDCSFTNNTARSSGGFDAFRSQPILTNCIFQANIADISGGAISVSGSELLLRGCLVHANRAKNKAGGLFNSLSSSVVTNCTFTANRGEGGFGGIYNFLAQATITNTLVAGNSPAIHQLFDADHQSESVVTWSSIEGGWEGEGNIELDPDLVFQDMNPRLMPGSPCINGGTPTPPGGLPEYDLDGTPRGAGGGVDIGAYEYNPATADPVLAVDTHSVEMIAYGTDDAAPATIRIRNAGAGTLTWSASVTQSWLTAWPASGSTGIESDEIMLTVDRSGLAPGTYQATVELADTSTKDLEMVTVSLVVGSEVIHVAADGTGDYPTIQDAIDAAGPADVVLLGAGTFTGEGNKDIKLRGKIIAVRGADPTSTIIDCQEAGRGFLVNEGEIRLTLIENLAITNGKKGYGPADDDGLTNCGGGIACQNASPTFRNCYVTDCLSFNGGGVFCAASSALFQDCRFIDNNAGSKGGGAYNQGASSEFQYCTFSSNLVSGFYGGAIHNFNSTGVIHGCVFLQNISNSNGGAISNTQSSPVISDCVFLENQVRDYQGGGGNGGGIFNHVSSPLVRNCTFLNNTSDYDSPDVFSRQSRSMFVNCIFWADTQDGMDDDSLRIELFESYDTITYSAVLNGWSGEGNIDEDPMLDENYRLGDDSPCIDAGAESIPGGVSDIDAGRNPRVMGYTVDMGAFEYLIQSEQPSMKLDPDWVRFVVKEEPPALQEIEILNTGTGTLAWSATSDASWLTISPQSGSSRAKSQSMTLTADTEGLEPGQYTATVTVTAPDAANSPKMIDVELHIGREIHVEADGSGDYPTIQEAIDAAVHGDVIICGDGTYTGEGNRDVVFLGKAITLKSANGPAYCMIDCGQKQGIIFDNFETADTVFEGFIVINAKHDNSYPYSPGGAVICRYSDPTIRNCRFSENKAWHGSAMLIEYSSPHVENCVFDLNTTEEGYFYENCGVVFAAYSAPTFVGCTFENNASEQYRSGCCGIFNWFSSTSVSQCQFLNNISYYFDGGSAITNYYSSLYLEDSQFRGNELREGRPGASVIGSKASDLEIVRCSFLSNRKGYNSFSDGGAITNFDGTSVNITNSLFANNESGGRGGAIYSENDCDVTLTNCTLADNRAYSAGGAVCTFDSSISIANCILWNNTVYGELESISNILSDEFVSWSNIQGGWAGQGNIDADPDFISPGLDNLDYRLNIGSPCVDAANNYLVPEGVTTDLAGLTRFEDDPAVDDTGVGDPPIVDMGALEFRVASGDADGDQDWDLKDFAAFQACFGSQEPACLLIFDYNDNSEVDFDDYSMFEESMAGPRDR